MCRPVLPEQRSSTQQKARMVSAVKPASPISPSLQSVWSHVLDIVRHGVTDGQFRTWFVPATPLSLRDSVIEIGVPNRFFAEWLTANYRGLIADAATAATGKQTDVHFRVVKGEKAEPQGFPADMGDATPDRSHLDAALNSSYTFDSFVAGPSNRLAHAAAVAVSEMATPGTPGGQADLYNPLFIHGRAGLGKTHLLQAMCHVMLQRRPRFRVIYVRGQEFVNQFVSAIHNGRIEEFRRKYRDLGVFVLDDMQTVTRAEASQEELLHTFNALYDAHKQIVLAAPEPPSKTSGLQARLVSRFRSGLIARIDGPGLETRMAILRRKAEERGIALPDDIADLIAQAATQNARELEGALVKVIGYASLSNSPLTPSVARRAIHDLAPAAPPVAIEQILKAVSRRFRVRVSDLQSKKRTKSLTHPRQICMYLARKLTRSSLQEVGGYFGGRDHSTVLHAEKKIKRAIKNDPAIQRLLDSVEEDIYEKGI